MIKHVKVVNEDNSDSIQKEATNNLSNISRSLRTNIKNFLNNSKDNELKNKLIKSLEIITEREFYENSRALGVVKEYVDYLEKKLREGEWSTKRIEEDFKNEERTISNHIRKGI